MQFKDIIGNEELKKRLIEIVDEGHLGHALMLIEKSSYGALPLALALIQYMSCSNKHDGDSCGECSSCHRMSHLVHPDVHFVFPVNNSDKSDLGGKAKSVSDNFLPIWRKLLIENPYFTDEALADAIGIENKIGVINVGEAKEIVSMMSLKSYEGGNKYMIILQPELMTIDAANRLLKIVEEPYPGTYFIFITHSEINVLKTILSRCLMIRLQPLTINELSNYLVSYGNATPGAKISREDAISYAKSVEGNIGLALESIKGSQSHDNNLSSIVDVLEKCIAGDLSAALKWGEQMAGIGRENQKTFLLFSESFLRKILMVQMKNPELAHMLSDEKPYVIDFAKRLPSKFVRKSYPNIELTRINVLSNVNSKICFANLVNNFYKNIKIK